MNDLWTDRLSEYLDDELPRDDAAALERHLETCDECRVTLESLRRVTVRARSLVDPPTPDDLWAGIATRIGPAGSTSDRARPRPARVVHLPAPARHFAFTGPQLAAAGIALLLVSAAAIWGMRASFQRGLVAGRDSVATPATGPAPTTASLATFDADRVEGEIATLQSALERGRGRLDPQTIAVLEKNLTLIRKATDDAKRALEKDPANADLRQYFASSVQQKLDLMKRASALAGV